MLMIGILKCYLTQIYPNFRLAGKIILFPLFFIITLVLIMAGIFEFFTIDIGSLVFTLLSKGGSVKVWKENFIDLIDVF